MSKSTMFGTIINRLVKELPKMRMYPIVVLALHLMEIIIPHLFSNLRASFIRITIILEDWRFWSISVLMISENCFLGFFNWFVKIYSIERMRSTKVIISYSCEGIIPRFSILRSFPKKRACLSRFDDHILKFFSFHRNSNLNLSR